MGDGNIHASMKVVVSMISCEGGQFNGSKLICLSLQLGNYTRNNVPSSWRVTWHASYTSGLRMHNISEHSWKT